MIKTGFVIYAYINFMPRTKEETYRDRQSKLICIIYSCATYTIIDEFKFFITVESLILPRRAILLSINAWKMIDKYSK